MTMEMQNDNSYRIVRRAGDQGARPPVAHQAGVGKSATGKERYSQPLHLSVVRAPKVDPQPTNKKKKRNVSTEESTSKQYSYWKLGTINVLTASDDLLLHECLRQCTRANLDICCFQEFRRLGNDSVKVELTSTEKNN